MNKVVVFVYAVESAVSKAGNTYYRQRVQIVQAPARPDVLTMHFVNSEAEALEPGKYVAEVYYVDSPTGPKVRFANFQPVK